MIILNDSLDVATRFQDVMQLLNYIRHKLLEQTGNGATREK